MEQKKIPQGYGLRLATAGAGCSGVRYIIGFDTVKPEDASFVLPGFSVMIEKKHFIHLAGMLVDFVDNEMERGFVFEQDQP